MRKPPISQIVTITLIVTITQRVTLKFRASQKNLRKNSLNCIRNNVATHTNQILFLLNFKIWFLDVEFEYFMVFIRIFDNFYPFLFYSVSTFLPHENQTSMSGYCYQL